MTARLDYYIMWRDEIVDRATNERVAHRRMIDVQNTDSGYRGRYLELIHVPNGPRAIAWLPSTGGKAQRRILAGPPPDAYKSRVAR